MMDNVREKLAKLIEESRIRKTENEGYCICGSHIIADNLLANGVTVQEWIPVTERLPEKSGEYLTYCGDYDGVCVLYYEVLKTKGKWRTRWKEVTHWMPLPTPPKGE